MINNNKQDTEEAIDLIINGSKKFSILKGIGYRVSGVPGKVMMPSGNQDIEDKIDLFIGAISMLDNPDIVPEHIKASIPKPERTREWIRDRIEDNNILDYIKIIK